MISKNQSGQCGQIGPSTEKSWGHFTNTPAVRNVTSRVMALERRRGNSIFYFLGGEDRTELLHKVVQKVYDCDARINVDDIQVGTIDAFNEAGIHMVFRHWPQADSNSNEKAYEETDWAMTRLEKALQEFDGQPIAGKRFAAVRTVRMATEGPEKPGRLRQETKAIAELGMNIRSLSKHTFGERALLIYTLALSVDDDNQLTGLKNKIEQDSKDTRSGYDAEADRMEQDFLNLCNLT